MPSSNDSLVIVVKQKVKYRFCADAMLFHTLQKRLP